MRTVEQTPTRPANYAVLTGVFGAGTSLVAGLARHRGAAPEGRDLVPLGLATFTATRVLSEQKVETWLRRPFVVEHTETDRAPRGRGLRYAIGELLLCTRCTGSWVALGLVGLHVASPTTGRLVAALGTIGACNDTALAGFAWLTSQANRAASAT